ncbi:MAG: hypothetical protein DRG59_13025 [Deltaproteobacteria bacterium]|nr:MAG: hypothetical protein DRG59_13025 [Deltaproteobacteria bacterium]
MKTAVQFGRRTREFEIIESPIPHILVDSKKELHGWWEGIEPYGNRECTAERLLINPYNGCTHNCFFCYAHALGGYFKTFREENGIVTVFRDFDRIISNQLDKVSVASCGYLSPVTDPFQPINKEYELSEKIIKEFVTRNIPIQFTTKGRIPDDVIRLIKGQEHSFGQVSILTTDEEKRKKLMEGGASTDELFRNIERLADEDVFTVCRVDPVIPHVTDERGELEELVNRAIDSGAKHIIASCMDIPASLKGEIYAKLEECFDISKSKLNRLYTERIRGDFNADLGYRRKLFRTMREICDRAGVTMALCMEFESLGGKNVKGLNREFMSSNNCEGIDVPIYVRRGDRFEPVEGCDGNCLGCYRSEKISVCGLPLNEARAWKLRDYRGWTKEINQKARDKAQRTFREGWF